ncbi:interleukin-17D [Brachionichthys hirsutus]|uniref:interleukin-17D n=1 Tax=Brachionichthys hirsutus TaxID=412623 RepID=UPI003604541F
MFRIRVLLLLYAAALLLDRSAGVDRVPKKAARVRSCLDLPEEVLEQMFGRLSVGVMSAFHHALQLEPQDKLNASCPITARSRSRTDRKTRLPVNLLSVSPWAYRMSHNLTRYPRYIPEAFCLCTGCLIGPRGEENLRYRSVPVYAPSVVLKRTGSCVGGRHSYVEIYVSVAVGCTCVPLQPEEPRGGQNRNGRPSLQDRTGPKARRISARKKV